MRRIGVLTSGGDAPGMNAAIRAVVRTSIQNEMSVIGFKRGYNGVLMRSKDEHDDFEILTSRSVSDKIHRGGTFLRTARCLDFLDIEYQKKAVENLRMLGVEGLVCIGGRRHLQRRRGPQRPGRAHHRRARYHRQRFGLYRLHHRL